MLNLLNPLELKDYLRSKLASDEDTTGKKSGWKTNENGQHYHIGENGEIDAGMGGKLDGVNPSESGKTEVKKDTGETLVQKYKHLNTDDFQGNGGHRSGQPTTVQVWKNRRGGASCNMSFKSTSEEQAKAFAERYFRNQGIPIGEITTYQSGDYHNDWVEVDVELKDDEKGVAKSSKEDASGRNDKSNANSQKQSENINNALSQIGTNKTDPESSGASSGGEFDPMDHLDEYKSGGEFKEKADKAWKDTVRNIDMDDPNAVRFAIGNCDYFIKSPNIPVEEKYGYAIAREELEKAQGRINLRDAGKNTAEQSASAESGSKQQASEQPASSNEQQGEWFAGMQPDQIEKEIASMKQSLRDKSPASEEWKSTREKIRAGKKEIARRVAEMSGGQSAKTPESTKSSYNESLGASRMAQQFESMAAKAGDDKTRAAYSKKAEEYRAKARAAWQRTVGAPSKEQMAAKKRLDLTSLTPAQIQQRLNHHRSMLRKNADNPEKQAAIQKKIDALTGERQRRKGTGETPENAGTVSPQTTGTAKKVSLADLSPAQIQQRLNHHRSMLRKAGDNPEKQAAIQKKIDALTGERQRRKGGQTEAGGTPQAAAPKKVSLSELNPAQIQQRLNHHRQQLKKHTGNPDKVAEIQKKIDALTGERVKRRNAAYEEKNAAKRANDPLAQRRQQRQEQAAAQVAQPKENPVQKPESKPAQKPAAKPAQATGERQKPKAPPAPSVSSLNDKQRKGYEIAKRLFGNKEMTAEQMQKKINDAMLLSQDPRRDIASMKDSSIGEAAFFQEKLDALKGQKVSQAMEKAEASSKPSAYQQWRDYNPSNYSDEEFNPRRMPTHPVRRTAVLDDIHEAYMRGDPVGNAAKRMLLSHLATQNSDQARSSAMKIREELKSQAK